MMQTQRRPDHLLHYQQQPPEQQQRRIRRPRPQRVVYMTRRPEPRSEPDPDQIIVIIIDEAELQLFIRKVYLIATIFIVATSVSWLAICATEFEFYSTIPVPYYAWLLPVLILLLIMDCVPQMRYTFPWNWVTTIVIVILIICAGASIMDKVDVIVCLVAIIISIVVVGVFYACGALCPMVLLPGIACSAILSCLLLITLFVVGIVLIFVKNLVLSLVFGILLLCMAVLIMPFHAQYIHGRLQVVPLADALHCSMTIYFHFLVILAAFCIIAYYIEVKDA